MPSYCRDWCDPTSIVFPALHHTDPKYSTGILSTDLRFVLHEIGILQLSVRRQCLCRMASRGKSSLGSRHVQLFLQGFHNSNEPARHWNAIPGQESPRLSTVLWGYTNTDEVYCSGIMFSGLVVPCYRSVLDTGSSYESGGEA